MSEFKFVQWGKGIPNDYQRLNAMMINDQYLKDKIDPAPRGVLLRKKVSATTYIASGGFQNINGLADLTFDIEANRSVSFYFSSGRVFLNSGSGEIRYHLMIDGAYTEAICGDYLYGQSAPQAFNYIPTAVLSQGNHKVSVIFVANSGLQFVMGQTGFCYFTIRDEGQFITEL